MDDLLIETFADGVATITLNRPRVYNALSYELIANLREVLLRLERDPLVRVVVLTGSEPAFCAGGDLNDMASRPAVGVDPARFDEDVAWVRAGMESSRCLYEMPKPTLAIMPGAAAGAGLALALACDARIVAEDAKLTTAFSRIAVSSDFGASYFLTELVGPAKARELLFFSTTFSGRQAVEMGLANCAVPQADLQKEGALWSSRLAELPTHAIGLMKANLRAARQGSLADALDMEAGNLVRSLGHHEFRSALSQFRAAG